MIIKEINKFDAIEFVQQYHYSKVFPRITKYYFGFYDDSILIGVITLGWGTQPLQTIKKIFPSQNLQTKDYYEIGKMCLHPSFNDDKNSGSQLTSALIHWLKNNTDLSFLYTLADGIVGRVGYVYQASNFLYGGYFWTDVYMGSDGEKIHPRSAKKLLKENAIWLNKSKVFWLTPDFCKLKGIKRIRGKMFRYGMPLNKKFRKLMFKSGWTVDYPKDDSLQWKQQINKGNYDYIEKPDFALDIVNVNAENVNQGRKENVCLQNMIFI